ncbi:uncharacterized protein LOC126630217 [Malus sylvestris]|uniref:uncharacterized protein LOC126630217 n=1 Tax=Malus sylvestris TaxID=3752 RepID=UPI0021AC7A34|nr:uncharacterized protein LOC126630217 [Malus sylvestris]
MAGIGEFDRVGSVGRGDPATEDVQAPSCFLLEPTIFPKEVLSPEEWASIEEWASWHKALEKLKHSIANEARVLSLIKELNSFGDAFFSRVNFRGVKVRSRLAKVLGKFFKRADDANVSLVGLSLFMRVMIFKELGLLFYGMEHTSQLELTKHRLLCWRDMISDVAALGVPVGSLVKRLGVLRDTMFGLQLEKEKGVLDQFIKVNKLMCDELQGKELEVEKLKLKKLVRESSKEIMACLQLVADQLNVGTSSSSSERVAISMKYLLDVPFNLCGFLTLLGSVPSIKKVRYLTLSSLLGLESSILTVSFQSLPSRASSGKGASMAGASLLITAMLGYSSTKLLADIVNWCFFLGEQGSYGSGQLPHQAFQLLCFCWGHESFNGAYPVWIYIDVMLMHQEAYELA